MNYMAALGAGKKTCFYNIFIKRLITKLLHVMHFITLIPTFIFCQLLVLNFPLMAVRKQFVKKHI